MISKKRKMDRSEMNIEGDRRSSRRSSSSMGKNTESQGSLPDDILINIFLYLPADLLYNVMRFICRHWYNIIQSPSFISSHLKNSTTGLFLAHYTPRWKAGGKKRYILKPTCGGVEVKELNFKCASEIKASCNGLVFVLGPNQVRGSQCPCYIANLVTKQQLPLPLIPDSGRWHFVYTPSSKVYKVFFSGEKKLILTVGVDKGWRKVDISELPSDARINHSNFSSVSIKGFLYWVQWNEVPYILCFDMETETFRQISLPPQFPNGKNTWPNHVLTMGSSLCLFKHVNDYSFVFWLLKDPESGHGQWGKMKYYNFTGQIDVVSKLLKTSRIFGLTPCGWLRNGKLLVLGTLQGVVVWNVDTNEFYNPEELYMDPFGSYPHVESLVPMNNLSLVMTPEHPSKIRKSTSECYSKDNMRAEFEEPS